MKIRALTYNIHGLPWSKNQSADIVRYLSAASPDTICLQEVFLDSSRLYFSKELGARGYTVVVPRDEGVTIMNSGLLTAFRSSRFALLSDCFYPYTAHHDIEIGANKGFHTVRLFSKEDGRRLLLLNTHTQSDTPFNVLSLTGTAASTRAQQFAELVRWLERDPDPVLLAGDMNCERSPHSHVRFLKDSVLKKVTLPKTGEDLDHIAWIPTQWAPLGTAWCKFDSTGVRALLYRIDPVPWSDHFPVMVDVEIPEIRRPVQGECGPSSSLLSRF